LPRFNGAFSALIFFRRRATLDNMLAAAIFGDTLLYLFVLGLLVLLGIPRSNLHNLMKATPDAFSDGVQARFKIGKYTPPFFQRYWIVFLSVFLLAMCFIPRVILGREESWPYSSAMAIFVAFAFAVVLFSWAIRHLKTPKLFPELHPEMTARFYKAGWCLIAAIPLWLFFTFLAIYREMLIVKSL